jgi:hypothetical protein
MNNPMNNVLLDYFKFPQSFSRLKLDKPGVHTTGYFQFGPETVCFGDYSGGDFPGSRKGAVYDARPAVRVEDGVAYLPFDPGEVIDNLRHEGYLNGAGHENHILKSVIARAYYGVRPILPLAIRRRVLRAHLLHRSKSPVPKWPVDTTVDDLAERLLHLSVQAQGGERIPFIWFWPEGASSAAIMTHDVETEVGREFCRSLMDLDDSFGIPASFQLIPEQRYAVSPEFLSLIKSRGFEVNVQDLNHDGLLFREKEEFLRRANKINAYAEKFRAIGFRSAILFRRQDWFSALNFQYDMSVPSTGHMDPQWGGCCTVMPYFVGDVLELPVTTIQDYSLFYILNQYSLGLWKQQTEAIMKKHGLMSFIVHPDYILGGPELQTYKNLLGYLAQLRKENNVWIATPGEVNRWWRERAQMKLTQVEDGWRIEGPGSERARIAYASEKDGHLEIRLDTGVIDKTPVLSGQINVATT